MRQQRRNNRDVDANDLDATEGLRRHKKSWTESLTAARLVPLFGCQQLCAYSAAVHQALLASPARSLFIGMTQPAAVLRIVSVFFELLSVSIDISDAAWVSLLCRQLQQQWIACRYCP